MCPISGTTDKPPTDMQSRQDYDRRDGQKCWEKESGSFRAHGTESETFKPN